MKVAVILISTGRYKEFVEPLLKGLDEWFLKDHEVSAHLFTDESFGWAQYGRMLISQYIIPPYKFPDATLLRYEMIHNRREYLLDYNFLVYLDVDMAIVDTVGDEFLDGDLTAVRHPGFWYNNGWGSGGNPPESKSYIGPAHQKKYYCGGVQGGKTRNYLEVCRILSEKIADDQKRGVMAIFHDETFWNYFLNYANEFHFPEAKINELTPSYCSVPEAHQRKMWQIDHLPMKIVALTKNHEEMRV